MPWFVFVFLGFFVAVLRLGARGERLEAAPLLTAINPVFVLSSRHWAKQRRMKGQWLEVRGSIRISVSRFLLSPVSSFPPPPPSRPFAPFAVKHTLVGFCVSCVSRGHTSVDFAPFVLFVAARRSVRSPLKTTYPGRRITQCPRTRRR